MNKIIPTILILIASLTLLFAGNTGCGKLQKESFTKISASQLHQMMDAKDFTLVNVHIPYVGEIPKTDLLIPYNEIMGHLDELPTKDKKIVLYCRSDRMSTIAAEKLANAGYSNVYNLKGGMKAWKKSGYQLIDNQSSKKSHSGSR